jgi:hypothetical protein
MNDWQHLNKQLKELSDATPIKVPVFGSLKLNQSELASGLTRDLQSALRYAQLEWPSIVAELNAPVPLSERYDALLGYSALAELGNIKKPGLQRARVITQLYFDLIYFRERILIILRQIILQQPERFGKLEYLSEWLEIVGDNPFAIKLRAVRNGFAHGRWAYLSGFSGLVFFPEQKPPYSRHEILQEELNLMHALLYGFQLVFFTVAKENLLKERTNP